jgi:uncharacterized membrane protein YeaQ/YmgE (transglycosylase-associated protein family)
MRYLFKDILAGVITAALAFILLYAFGFLLAYQHRREITEQTGIGWDPVRALTPAGLLVYVVVAAIVGALVAHRFMR